MNKPSIARIETNVDAVLESFEKCETGVCDGCAFEYIRCDWPAACAYYQQQSARYLLKKLAEQTPRVMTLEEVLEWAETPAEKRDPVFFEQKKERGPSGWICRSVCPKDYYLCCLDKDARCWTARPTDAQREAVKWDE